jgi:hypothetical protein
VGQQEIPLIGDSATQGIVRVGRYRPSRRWRGEEGVKDKMPRADVWIFREGPAVAAAINRTG